MVKTLVKNNKTARYLLTTTNMTKRKQKRT